MTVLELAGPTPNLSLESRPSRGSLRPVQYLGNKQRSLDTILAVVSEFADAGDGAADLFSGTSVVAQGLASLALRVTALDASASCAAMARATLGVNRQDRDVDGAALVNLLAAESKTREEALGELFGKWIAAEDLALAAEDGGQLIDVSRAIPQVWRGRASGPLSELFNRWHEAANAERYFCAVMAPVFAGTYLGVRQAVALDARRAAITALSSRRVIDRWEEAVLVTGLLAAASAAAFSPGKHFAQPHKLDPAKDLTFHRQRILADRSIDVGAMAEHWIGTIIEGGRPGSEAHSVIEQPVESVTSNQLRRRGIRVVYADPPYTAQQYSRFYHALDALALGRARPLQRTRDQVTSGLYPEGRFLSPFCSKRQARPAFAKLASVCRGAGATLLLSYSSSSSDSTGNERMIALSALREVLGTAYGDSAVEVVELDHQYRQFNHRDVARPSRSDPEILVIAHAP